MNLSSGIQVFRPRIPPVFRLFSNPASSRPGQSSELVFSRNRSYSLSFPVQRGFDRAFPVLCSSNDPTTRVRKFHVFNSQLFLVIFQTEVGPKSVSVVLLAGGIGKRMGAKIPKQFLELNDRAIATYSFETFAKMTQTLEIVVVVDPSWRYIFEDCVRALDLKVSLKWALPGKERQDSVYNGFMEIDNSALLVSIHDSARPLVEAASVLDCLHDGLKFGAAVLGVRVKPTIKQVGSDQLVLQTLDRSQLWEVQTPQVIRPDLLKQGFKFIKENDLDVTDDVSIIEALGLPVKVTEGSYTNLKLTTPDDLSIAERFLSAQKLTV
eukprot:g5080.t1